MSEPNSQFHVRPFLNSDAESMLQAVSASLVELCEWLPWAKPDYSLSDAKDWIKYTIDAWAQNQEFPLGIFQNSTGAVVGGTGINHINKAYGIGNIGYWVSTPFTKRGVARFAAMQAAHVGFRDLGLTRLEIIALMENIPSQRVAEAVGAQRECVARNRLRLHGAVRSAVVYSLVPSDLVSIHVKSPTIQGWYCGAR